MSNVRRSTLINWLKGRDDVGEISSDFQNHNVKRNPVVKIYTENGLCDILSVYPDDDGNICIDIEETGEIQ